MHNIYKKYEDGTWGNYIRVEFPDGQVMDENSHDFERDGFFWSDEPPTEFLTWLSEQHDISN
jgi:hypothetical protein